MPSRQKTLTSDSEGAVEKSLLEWGAHCDKSSATFRRIVSQVKAQASSGINPVIIEESDLVKLPVDQKDAIQFVFSHDLKEYLNEKMFRLRLQHENLYDSFSASLTTHDDPTQILNWPPKYVDPDGVTRTKVPFQYERFSRTMCPFERFSLLDNHFSPAELAIRQCNEGWMHGYAFEAIVASHAIHNESCYCCKAKESLFWCGGAETSWRDMFCHACQSCFEIKSKKDGKTIDKIFRFNSMACGSYRKWCEEGFCGRRQGRDYIVIVDREAHGDAWDSVVSWRVEIAQIETVLPQLTPMSFVDIKQDTKNISLKTTVALKNRQLWFSIPKKCPVDFQKLFRTSFESVFPNQWDDVTKRQDVLLRGGPSQRTKVAATKTTTLTNVRMTAVSFPTNFSSHRRSKKTNRSTRTAFRSLCSEFEGMSLAEREDDNDSIDYYEECNDNLHKARKHRAIATAFATPAESGLCKHNGYKMNDNGHYGKRRPGRKKGGKKYDDYHDYF